MPIIVDEALRLILPDISSRFPFGLEGEFSATVNDQVQGPPISQGSLGLQYSEGWDGGPWLTVQPIGTGGEPIECDVVAWSSQGGINVIEKVQIFEPVWVRAAVWASQDIGIPPELAGSVPMWWGPIET